MRHHRGFSLIELMIVLVVMLAVTGGILKLLNTTQRLSQAQAEKVDLQSNVRTASIVIPSELREINTVVGGSDDQNDILDMQSTSIQYRAMRGVGYVCPGSTVAQLRLYRFSGYRDPQAPRDAAYVFIENDEDLSSDDVWQAETISGIGAGNTCYGQPAVTLNITPSLTAVPADGTPVRTYEVMELSLYDSDGQFWLGARSVSAGEAIQPLLGPLTDDGLELSYLDANGDPAATVKDVKSVVLTVRGVTTQGISGAGVTAKRSYVEDSLVSQVSLRNAFRP